MLKDSGPRMEMRALLAIVLSMLVLTLYQYFFVPPPVTTEAPAVVAEPARESANLGTPQQALPAPVEQVDAQIVGDGEQTVEVRAQDYVARITNVGGRIAGFELPAFSVVDGTSLDLVSPAAAAEQRLPLELATPSAPAAAEVPNAALFTVAVSGGRRDGNAVVPEEGRPVTVSLRWADGRGWDVEKTLTFPARGNQLGVHVVARAPGGVPVYLSSGLGLDASPSGSRNVFLGEGALVLRGDELETWDADDLASPVAFAGQVRWAGVESHYFLAAFLLDSPAEILLTRAAVVPELDEEGEEVGPSELVSVAVRVPDGGLDAPVYFGPKKYDYLQQQGYGLHRVVNFGWLGLIARPLLFLLNGIEGFVGNYGLAIILLTVLLRLVFWPLNHKAMVSMRKTQSLQPQMAAIRAKYKGAKEAEKRQKMNEEIMALYQQEGVSPLGGCLPMVAQMPILFAFYRLLSIAIELRGAPFVLWIHDLAQYDPYLVLPLTMGASMIVQQRMTPTAGGNPGQASVMRMMPVMFTFLFLWVPSGLVLYWLVNNLLGIGQQVYINKKIEQDKLDATSPKKRKNKQRGNK